MNAAYDLKLRADLDVLKEAGTYKRLRHLTTPMGAHASMGRGRRCRRAFQQ